MPLPRIGFIVEGTTEERVFPPLLRRHLLDRRPQLPLDRIIGRVIVDGGSKVRDKTWVSERVKRLRQGRHDYVLVVADQEAHPSPAAVRDSLDTCGADGVFIASPKFERWLLADPTAVQSVLGKPRPTGWRTGDPLDILLSLKPGYKKVSDGTLLGEASSAAAWAEHEPEFCALLRRIEAWLQLTPTNCIEPPAARRRRAVGRRRRARG